MFCPKCETEFSSDEPNLQWTGVTCPNCKNIVSFAQLKEWVVEKEQQLKEAQEELAKVQTGILIQSKILSILQEPENKDGGM